MRACLTEASCKHTLRKEGELEGDVHAPTLIAKAALRFGHSFLKSEFPPNTPNDMVDGFELCLWPESTNVHDVIVHI